MAHNTPLYDVLTRRASDGALRFHMPGHKGKNIPESPLAGATAIDFTELYGTGNLYDGLWPIADAERAAAQAYEAPQAFFLTGGATMGIHAALLIARARTGQVLIDRGCHKSVYNGMGLLGLTPVYIRPGMIEPFHVSDSISPECVEHALSDNPAIGAIVITCPTYYGVMSDIEGIARAAHSHGALLIVDEAHGAHLPFMDGYKSAAARGADIAVCSMHKTLPALGQAALMLTAHDIAAEEVRRACAIFGTSSPSYNIMASMDLARDFMENEGRVSLRKLVREVSHMRADTNKRGVFEALNTGSLDPLRLCVMTAGGGISGYNAARILEDKHKIVCEMADERNVLFIITAADTIEELKSLANAIYKLEEEKACTQPLTSSAPAAAKTAMSLTAALHAKNECVELKDANGRVAACNLCPYPPGIPTIAVGEVIEQSAIEYLCNNGFAEDDLISVII
ncbi:MAG: aminotransferase class V-fold PLP-dependent enzyme [Clostridia bacterium]